MKVLLIPEDARRDKYILKPLFSRLFKAIGSPHASVRVCEDPLLGGVGEALKTARLAEIVQRYRETNIFILCVDRDGNTGRRQQLDQIEAEFGDGQAFLAENAWEEIETWVLAGLDLPKDWRWRDVRAEVHVKETYFEPLAVQRGLSNDLGGGRKRLGEEASRRVADVRRKCPEDFGALASCLEAVVRAV